MRSLCSLNFFAFALSTCLASMPLASAQQEYDWKKQIGPLKFHVGYEKGLAQSRFSGMPMLIFVSLPNNEGAEQIGTYMLRPVIVQERLKSFVLVLVDGTKEPDVARQYDRHGTFEERPKAFVRFASADETPAHPQLGFVGPMPWPPEWGDWFLKQSSAALDELGPVRPSKGYRSLLKAAKQLKKALEKERYKSALAAIETIEKLNHPSAELEAANAARKLVAEVAAKRLAEAVALEKSDPDRAVILLRKVAKEFKGLDAAEEARKRGRALSAR